MQSDAPPAASHVAVAHVAAAHVIGAKRKWTEDVEFVYKRRKVHSIPDILATAQTLQPVPDVRELDDFIQFALQRCVSPRISIFNFLGTPRLQQAFSLDNGVVLQEMVIFILANGRKRIVNGEPRESPVKRGRSKRGKSTDTSAAAVEIQPEANPYYVLYEQREFSGVWWEARLVRVVTWPSALESLLLDFLGQMISMIMKVQASDLVCNHARPPRNIDVLNDFCQACLRRHVHGNDSNKKKSLNYTRPH